MSDPVTSNAWAQLAQLRAERDEARADLAIAKTGAAPVGAYARIATLEAERDRAIQCLTDISRERGELVLLLRECEWGNQSPTLSEWRCPICGEEAGWDHTRRAVMGTHAPDCRLKAALEAHDAVD